MSESVLACHQLAKTYMDSDVKIEVLQNINLTIKPAETVAIIGTSGSGKSTLLHLLGGLDQPTSGDVFINGKNLQSVTEVEKCALRNRYLGFIYQFHHLLPEFSALENVGMPLLIRGDKPKEIEEKSADILGKVGLSHRLNHRLGQLSGGERQRVAIARALITHPLCILADEPTGNLDPKNAERVLDLFLDLQKSFHTSVVIVTHDHEIAKAAQRVLRIDAGDLTTIS